MIIVKIDCMISKTRSIFACFDKLNIFYNINIFLFDSN